MLLAYDTIQMIDVGFVSVRTFTLRLLHSTQPCRDLVCVLLVPFGRVSTVLGVLSMGAKSDIDVITAIRSTRFNWNEGYFGLTRNEARVEMQRRIEPGARPLLPLTSLHVLLQTFRC